MATLVIGKSTIANAHYQHANTETIVGHVTLATGTFPSQKGMIDNVWFDREAEELSYRVRQRARY
jgi:predicted AlkP superfamily pyrophosphatase or phosphodiesterase